MTGRPITEAERILRRNASAGRPPSLLAQLGDLLGRQATVTLTDGSTIAGTVIDLTRTDTTVAGRLVTLSSISEVVPA